MGDRGHDANLVEGHPPQLTVPRLEHRHRQVVLAGDHMVVGHHVAVGMDHEARTHPDGAAHLDDRRPATHDVLLDGQLAPLRGNQVDVTAESRGTVGLSGFPVRVDPLDLVGRNRQHGVAEIDDDAVRSGLENLAADRRAALQVDGAQAFVVRKERAGHDDEASGQATQARNASHLKPSFPVAPETTARDESRLAQVGEDRPHVDHDLVAALEGVGTALLAFPVELLFQLSHLIRAQ